MTPKVEIRKNTYYDSVKLMSLSQSFQSEPGVGNIVIAMGSQMNKDLLDQVGLLTKEAQDASDNDLIIAAEAESDERLNEIFQAISKRLDQSVESGSDGTERPVRTLKAAMERLPDANLAVISIPGQYAAREARRVLEEGLHVMIFSDNVTVEEELSLKKLGQEKGLLVMGPDCGTAIINGVGLCFANEVARGAVGLVAASGTGLQEVSVQIDRLGAGISQAIGVGGRDLHEEIGGIMMLEGLKALEADEATKVITLISKPPSPSVSQMVLEQVKRIRKPVVVCFLGGDPAETEQSGAIFASTLIDAARQSVRALGLSIPSEEEPDASQWAKDQIQPLAEGQKYVRGLFAGGTLTSEALHILRTLGFTLKSNVSKRAEEKLAPDLKSAGHTLLDMGDDHFTKGKPHPMIEPALRNERILEEARDPETAVLLLDFELGLGAHEDPVGESIDAIRQAMELAKANGRHLAVISYLLGTGKDKQGYDRQKKRLEEQGVWVAKSNAAASKLAWMIAERRIGE